MTERDPFSRLRELSAPGAILDPDVLARILEVLPDAVLVIDEGGVVRHVNNQAELLFGYQRADVLGQTVEILLPEGIRDRHAAHRREFFADPRVRPMGLGLDLKGRKRNGDEIRLEINLSPIVTGHGVYAVAVIRKRREYGTSG
jgi:PAS domain S-box-containing protein